VKIGPGNIDVRKVQLTGGSTYTLSLPKAWVDEMSLSPRDGVRVDWRPSGALRLSPLNRDHIQQKTVFINAEKLPKDSLHDHLMGAYISGVDKILITFSANQKRGLSKQIRRFLRNTRGFEIMDETDSTIELLCLLRASEMPLAASINRMYTQLSSLVRDIVSVIKGESKEILSDANEREAEVDALLYLVQRQVATSLDSYFVANSLKVSRNQAVEYSNLARALERMMDHSLLMADLTKISSKKSLKSVKLILPQIQIWQEAIKQLMINIRTKDSHEIEHSRHQLKFSQNEVVQLEEQLMKDRKQITSELYLFRMLESIRRLCAYARDFGEVLLNIKLHDESYSDKVE
tara:strand:+ start:2696 stop:3739 length:1044 start_codon:yes stop_codon:yes gene_type:complete